MSVTQLHNCTPEELTSKILSGIQNQLEEIKSNLQPKEPDDYLDRKEVSKLLKVSYATLHTWCNKGILEPMKIGSRVYFSRKAIERTLQESID
ncbi:helix-turn-helix domain-containing protein [Christiangramia marina]|uniref:helix-turn-helix domain-containing protein n=1 Tax=Christiangramia marina TaxID=409436 RepID=UPI003AA8489C